MSIYLVTIYFQLVAGFLPIIFYFRKFSIKYLEIFILFIASFISTFLVLYTYLNKLNNHIVFNSYVIIEFICITIFYYRISKQKYKLLFLILSLVFISISSFDFYVNSYLALTSKYTSFIFIIYGISYLLQVIFNKSNESDSLFLQIFSGANLFYNGSAFLLIYFISKLVENDLWYIHNIIEGISKLLIAYAFWKLPRQTNSLA